MNATDAAVFIVTAPSGAGKTTLVSRLIAELSGIAVSVSHTTRPMRPGEVDGQHYHFVDTAAFESLIAEDGFLEHARVFDNYYGTSVQAVNDCVAAGHDVILEIDWQGAEQARQKLPDTRSVFILPPSREALVSRLKSRGQDAPETIERRTNEAVEEMQHYKSADFLLVNDDFESTLTEFKAIILAERARMARCHRQHEALIKQLLA